VEGGPVRASRLRDRADYWDRVQARALKEGDGHHAGLAGQKAEELRREARQIEVWTEWRRERGAPLRDALEGALEQARLWEGEDAADPLEAPWRAGWWDYSRDEPSGSPVIVGNVQLIDTNGAGLPGWLKWFP